MENRFLYKFVEELRQRCRFAQLAYQNLRSSLQGMDAERTFYHAHAFLDQSLQASLLCWPEKAESGERGQKLREAVGLSEKSVLRMSGIKSQLVGQDERFEDWLFNLGNTNYVDMNIMPQGTIAGHKPDDFHRSLDPEDYRLQLRGEECELRPLCEELRKVEAAAQTWLRTHNPW